MLSNHPYKLEDFLIGTGKAHTTCVKLLSNVEMEIHQKVTAYPCFQKVEYFVFDELLDRQKVEVGPEVLVCSLRLGTRSGLGFPHW